MSIAEKRVCRYIKIQTWCFGGSSHAPLWQSTLKQHCPGILTSRGYGQDGDAGGSLLLQRGAHPTAPSMQVHWCLHPARKLSPFWYILPLYSHVRPSDLAEKTTSFSSSSVHIVPIVILKPEWQRGVQPDMLQAPNDPVMQRQVG